MLIQGPVCASQWGNTGVSDCSFKLDKLEGLLVVRKDKGYDMATYATKALFIAALGTDTLQAVKRDRLYPIFHVDGVTDNTGDAAIAESTYGKVKDAQHAQPRWTVNLSTYGLKALQNINQFAGNKNLSVMPVFKGGDGNSVILSRKGLDGKNYGLECIFYTSKASPAAGINLTENQFMIAFDDYDAFFSSALEFIPMDAGIKLRNYIHGVHDLTLKVASAANNAITVAVVDSASGEIMGDSYEAALEQVTSPNIAWLLNLVSTGANVPITSCTWNSTTKLFTLAGTFTLAAHKLTLASPSALAALATPFGNAVSGGFESNIVDVTPA
jgi:hypothetical protein